MTNANTATVRRVSYVSIIALSIVAVATLVFYGSSAEAVKTTYKFVVRGDVKAVDRAGNTVTVYGRYSSAEAKEELAGSVVEFNVKGAKVYKYDEKLKKMRTTLGALNLGDEVVLQGNKKKAGQFRVSKITRNYHTVNLRGTLQGHDLDGGILEVDIDKLVRKADGKAYKTKTFPKGTRVKVYYDKDSTKVVNNTGVEINRDDIANSNEKVTILGITMQYGSRFTAGPDVTVWDGKYTF